MTSFASPLWRNLQVYQIYGANTNVGKTIASTLLCRAANATRPGTVRGAGFIKPVSTGPLSEADDRHIRSFAPGTISRCLYQFKEPVSPHIAATDAKYIPSDDEVVSAIHSVLSGWAKQELHHAFVETAGGVHSPGPSGTSQADLYRPLRLPVVLVADAHLGGISSSIAAYESLLVRGYDVQSVLVFKDSYYRNDEYLLEYFEKRGIPLFAISKPPERPIEQSEEARMADQTAMETYYSHIVQEGEDLPGLMSILAKKHDKRFEELETMAHRAHRTIWYPFTQHKDLQPEALTTIDSAYGDQFQTFQSDVSLTKDNSSTSLLGPVFDGSASWWTQGLGHGNPELSLGAAYAAGRYGHVMFALGAHEPAIRLADVMLKSTRNRRLTRVFYSDNGSTGMEVAVKMALRAACDRYGWNGNKEEIGIIGLRGSYHGDTIGTMDCSEPSTFNKRVEWYRGRGFWFDFPQVKMIQGSWTIEQPEGLNQEVDALHKFSSLAEIFDLTGRQESKLADMYRAFIRTTLNDLCHNHGRKFGALILEPIVLGAGGMLLVDPLFQHILVETIRTEPQLISEKATLSQTSSTSWSGLPVVFDEVFTGLYRFFHFSPSTFFPESSRPDIAVNAKLLTGGLMPLAVTLASEEIFAAFNSTTEKEQALLHGHSYTAHPVGCHVACISVQKMMDMERAGAWNQWRERWPACEQASATSGNDSPVRQTKDASRIWSVWSHSLIEELSCSRPVESVWALGTVLAIVLKDQDGGGYSSSVAQDLQKRLRLNSDSNSDVLLRAEGGFETRNVHFDVQSRVLGNVFYLMTSLTSRRNEIDKIADMLRTALI